MGDKVFFLPMRQMLLLLRLRLHQQQQLISLQSQMTWNAKTKSFGVLSIRVVAMKMLRLPVRNYATRVKTLASTWKSFVSITPIVKSLWSNLNVPSSVVCVIQCLPEEIRLQLLLILPQQILPQPLLFLSAQHHVRRNFKDAIIITTTAKENLALRHLINVGEKLIRDIIVWLRLVV